MEPEAKIDAFLSAKRGIRAPLDITHSALLVIDMQGYQVSGDGAIAKFFGTFAPGVLDYFAQRVKDVVVPSIAALLGVFREARLPVLFTRYASNRPDLKDYPPNIQMFNSLAEKTTGEAWFPSMFNPTSEILPELAPRIEDGEIVLLKTTSCAFTSTDLDHLLRNLHVSTLVICGVVTNMCVESAARIAADLGFRVVVVDDACAAWSPAVHAASLRSLELLYCDVMKTAELVKIVRRSLPRKNP
ncbi:MAG: cysteine hydrolase family protein [Candidatus Sigynarchaeota archaeon]